MRDLVHELRGLAIGMAAPSLARDTVSSAANEIERLTRQRDEFKEQAERQMTLILVLRAALTEACDELETNGNLPITARLLRTVLNEQ